MSIFILVLLLILNTGSFAKGKAPKVHRAECPVEVDGSMLRNIMKGFAFKDYKTFAHPEKVDLVAGPLFQSWGHYKAKTGIIYDIYALPYEKNKINLEKLVNLHKLEAGKLQLLPDMAGKCIYYTEMKSKDKHKEILLMFSKSPRQKLYAIPPGALKVNEAITELEKRSTSMEGEHNQDDPNASAEDNDENSNDSDDAEEDENDNDESAFTHKEINNDDENDGENDEGEDNENDNEDVDRP